MDFKVFNFDNFCMFSCSRNAQVFFVEKTQYKIIGFKIYTNSYLIHTCSDKAFKGAVVNQALSSLHEGSLKIALTVPLKQE